MISSMNNCRCSVSLTANVVVDDQVLLVAYIVSGIAGIVLSVLAIFIGVKIKEAKKMLEMNLKEREEGIVQTWSIRVNHGFTDLVDHKSKKPTQLPDRTKAKVVASETAASSFEIVNSR